MSERDDGTERVSARPVTGSTELFLTIENAIEDRVRTYRQLLRMKQVLADARRAETEK